MKYTYDSKSIKFERMEQDKSTLLIMNGTNHQVVLNRTGRKILDMLYKFKNTEELLEELSNCYTDIDKRVLESDMMELLYLMDIYGIISLDEETKDIQITNRKQFKITGDINYKQVSKFIINALNNNSLKFYQESNEEFYKPVSLRARVVNNYEYGVFSIIDNDIYSYMSISSNPLTISSVLNINTLFFKENLSDDIIKDLVSGMLNRIIRIISSHKSIRKIRLTLCDCENQNKLLEILKELNFKLECKLENETEKGDIMFYTLFY